MLLNVRRAAGPALVAIPSRLSSSHTAAAAAVATVSGVAGCSPPGRGGSSVALLHCTRVLRRPQTVKSNPFQTSSGKFDKSFEKVLGTLESRHPFRQHHFAKGHMYDRNFGDETFDEMKESAKEDVEGREKESLGAKQARSYFDDRDLSPEAMHVRSPHLKVAQHITRQKYDKRLLKTSTESAEYYYHERPLAEKQRATALWVVGSLCSAVVLYGGWRRLAAYMRQDGDPLTLDAHGAEIVLARSPRSGKP